MMDNIYVASPTVALLVSVGLQLLKNSAWFPWMARSTGRLNAWISGGAALLTSLGIAVSFDFDTETGRFAAGVSGNVWDTLHVLAHWPVQWAEQHAFYKGLIVPAETLGEIRAILRDLVAQRPPIKTGE